MTMTVPQACQVANCTPSTITKLIKAGHVEAIQKVPRGAWHIKTPRAEIKRAVAEHAPKASGPRSHSGKRKGTPREIGGLHEALKFAALDSVTRGCLLALADRFTPDELKLLLTL